MIELHQFYVDGKWVTPCSTERLALVKPDDETTVGTLTLGSSADIDRGVAAARAAFHRFARTSRAQRLELLGGLISEYRRRRDEIAEAITLEMGAPPRLAYGAQFEMGLAHLETARATLRSYDFEKSRGSTLVTFEPIGVCGFITPWNWPLNQVLCKVAPALAVGCTMVLKPSEHASLSARIVAEMIDAVGVPAGVFNMIYGNASAGAALAAHHEVDMMSFTGSTRAGVAVAMAAAPTVKRVTQELGGKSPHILLDDADFTKAIPAAISSVMLNSGQTCAAATRLLVPVSRIRKAEVLAQQSVATMTVGSSAGSFDMGPVASQVQWARVQRYIEIGIEEGPTLLAGGTGLPDGIERGYFVRPTLFGDVRNDMVIAREEIFGPVLTIIPYRDDEHAIAIANDSLYGLAASVSSSNLDRARSVGRRLRAGQIAINGAGLDLSAPFGGYKQSGNGREWGDFAFAEYLEVKAIVGYDRARAS